MIHTELTRIIADCRNDTPVEPERLRQAVLELVQMLEDTVFALASSKAA